MTIGVLEQGIGGKMKPGVQKSLIAAGSAILVAAISIPATATISGAYYQSNNNFMTINLDGERVVVTAEKYEDLIRENESMSKEIESLESEIQNVNKKDEDDADVETNAALSQGATKLKDLVQVDAQNCEFIEPFTDSYGNQYETGYQFDASDDAYAVYGLQGKYSSFSGMVVCSNETGSGAIMSMMIYKDDELIDTITDITKQTETRQIGPYDISDARRLTIKTSNSGAYSYGQCYLVNAVVE